MILFCPDSFKGCITSSDLCQKIKLSNITTLPLGDGGEGFLDILDCYQTLAWHSYSVSDPSGSPISVPYVTDKEGHAFIECAQVIGHQQKPHGSLLKKTTQGLGQLIKKISKNHSHIIISAGGTAVHDGGFGLLKELGALFHDKNKHEISWEHFEKIYNYTPPPKINASIQVLCDVQTKFLDSVALYAPQKSASQDDINILNKRFKKLGSYYHNIEQPMGGVGGGISLALQTQLNAQLVSGFDYIAQLSQLHSLIDQAQLIITGEGKLDKTSLEGKVVSQIAHLAHQHNKKCHVICGDWDHISRPAHIDKIISLSDDHDRSLDPRVTTQRIIDYLKSTY